MSENITLRRLHLDSHGYNNDGCDPESCQNVLVEDCYFDTGDDCIAIKSGKDAVTILHIVNLFLFVGTPEITVAPQPIVCREFNPLANGEILPQSATIGTQFHLRKVGNESVADAVVVKIDFAVVLQLVSDGRRKMM